MLTQEGRLQSAVDNNRVEEVKSILEESNEIDKELISKLLVYSSFYGKIEIVEYLLSMEGVDVNYEDDDGDTALKAAVKQNQKSVIGLLLKQPSVDKQSKKLSDFLVLASWYGSYETVQLLLTIDEVKINHQDEDGDTALQAAAKQNRKKVLECLLEHPAVDKSPDILSELLVFASWYGSYETLEYLLTLDGVDVNYKLNAELIRELKRRGKHKNEDGNTALHLATVSKHKDVVEMLLKQPNIDIYAG